MDSRLRELIALRVQLRRLPEFAPPADAWQHIERALAPLVVSSHAEPVEQSRARFAPHWRIAAAAAVLPVCALALFWLQREGALPITDHSFVPTTAINVATLVDRSQRLEALLQQMPPRPAVERAVNSAAIDALQSRIQLLDMELSSNDGSGNSTQTGQLWDERVQLLNSLVGMRYAEAVRVDVQAATHDGAI